MTTELTGASFLGHERVANSTTTFQAKNPATGETLEPSYPLNSKVEVDRACNLAANAFATYRRTSPSERAAFLRAIAENLEAMGEAITARFVAESGLPAGRAEGERARTAGQLRLFANEIEKPTWNRPVIEHANPDRTPLPKPDTRLRYVPLGPVAVFGPANFPLAFTVAGGDSASALAAGCPVVVKAHSSHPGVSELVGLAISQAAQNTGMPEGVFSLLYGSGREIGATLVQHPAIKAVGFTGSESVGRSLFNLAAARPEPIPVFAEMSSINPVLFLEGALAEKTEALADGLATSLTMGVGQFCTNPGLILLPKSETAATFAGLLKEKLAAQAAQTMLNAGTCRSYQDGMERLNSAHGVEALLPPQAATGEGRCDVSPALFRVSAADFIAEKNLHEEVFGPTTLLVSCEGVSDMNAVLEALGGQLTISLHATEAELAAQPELLSLCEIKAGRLVANGFPTGVEVCDSMVHGGPYPATTDGRFTSVGTRALDRFLRPVCYQGFPGAALPEELT